MAAAEAEERTTVRRGGWWAAARRGGRRTAVRRLVWFKDSGVTRVSVPCSVIPVANCLTVNGAEDTLHRQFTFELSTPAETMYFITNSEKEKEWINSIGRSIVQHSYSITDAAAPPPRLAPPPAPPSRLRRRCRGPRAAHHRGRVPPHGPRAATAGPPPCVTARLRLRLRCLHLCCRPHERLWFRYTNQIQSHWWRNDLSLVDPKPQ
uniref:PH domain-containing protein n=1 Tax=Oryza meridionalis TaxID=40149 RepID=A0A0E0F2X1_9ORYZ